MVTGLSALPALADTPAPPTALPTTVSADVLPTPQINGVVWKVAVVGNTAYAVGSFTSARPSGAAPGVNQVTRNNAMAFDIATGTILPWNPNLNAQGLAISVSPDSSELYVGGDFTAVSGQAQNKIAGFKLPSGALDTAFKPAAYGHINTVSVSNTTVYAGGSFASAGSQTRANLAAFNRANGSLKTWAPTADDIVQALAAYPDDSRIIVGGRFQSLNGQGIVGIGAVDGATGASEAWSSRPIPTAQGVNNRSWTTDLIIKDGIVYGGADGEGGHWFDGRFAANAATGDLVWLDNCYGATYGQSVIGEVIYYVDHSHDCTSVGTFPQQNPNVWKRGIANTIFATGTDQGAPGSNMNYSYQPVPTQLNWYPDVNAGTYTGQYQGGWSLGTNGTYLIMGGEFTSIGGKAQQGLATFATRNVAPNKIGPVYTAAKPSAISLSGGTVRVAFTGTSDPDDAILTYKVFRDSSTSPVYTVNANSPWWALPQLGFTDTGLAPGSTHTYKVTMTDPSGNSTQPPKSDPVTVSSSVPSAYSQQVIADGAVDYWPLNEASGTVAYDNAGFSDADAGTGVTRGTTGPVPDATASTMDGTNNGNIATRSSIVGPNVFTLEAWFKTTSTAGGKIIGFGDTKTGDSSSYDRQVYLDGAGHVTFGVYPGGVAALTSSAGFNDGQWHMVTASLGATGMTLYLDGVRVASRSDVTSAQAYSGYWRIGGDNLNGWPNTGSSNDLAGSIGQVAVYPTVLTRDTVVNHYNASGRTANVPAAPTDTYGKAVFADNPEIYWRLDDTSGSTMKDSSESSNAGLRSGGVTLGTSGALAGGVGSAATFNGQNGLIAASNSETNPTVYSIETWFKTTTTVGGKLIGFGNTQTGTSGNYDRHIYMQNDGSLVFGTYTGVTNTAISPLSYNDGKWHSVVGTQSSNGMQLYVDGVLVATNSQTAAQNYTGYWRIGGDTTWGSSSAFFNGQLDEAAVYTTALSSDRILTHYELGSGTVPNQLPTAAFTPTTTDLTTTLDASASHDPDGTIASYAWNFGDSSPIGSGSTTTHTYSAPGQYTVTLTVTDNNGATAQISHQVVATAPNVPPTAAFTMTTTPGTVSADGSTSADPDGTIASYTWNWGDGGPASDPTATPTAVHAYSSAGTYTVSLTVTDNKGASNTLGQNITVAAPPNVPPVALFTSQTNGLTASFDGSSSSDPDGTMSAWNWNFGDGTTAAGAMTTHLYAANGTYPVTLTVTDNKGATAQISHTVSVSAVVVPTAYAKDSFGRTVANGFGTADLGGAWTTSNSTSKFSVIPGVGKILLSAPGSGPTISLAGVSAADTEVNVGLGLDKAATGGGVYASVIGRSVSGQGDYRAKVTFFSNGAVALGVERGAPNGTQATLVASGVIPGLTYSVGDVLNVRMQVVGTSPTTVNAKVWKNGTTEPATWQRSTTDTTAAMQSAGSIGLFAYLSSTATNAPVNALWSNLLVNKSTN
ncbi:hypothetical protein ASC63_06585 [Leifsonia sp. Root112D2]|nr:hypothetical protein ASC63_06585 [Leifsonia sp. Root112D2]